MAVPLSPEAQLTQILNRHASALEALDKGRCLSSEERKRLFAQRTAAEEEMRVLARAQGISVDEMGGIKSYSKLSPEVVRRVLKF